MMDGPGKTSLYIRRLKRELRECIKHRLTEKQREALLCCEYRGMTQEQAAERLGVERSSVARRLSGAEKKLRKYLLR